jgi:metallophosphoesterase (TIGR03767 family)
VDLSRRNFIIVGGLAGLVAVAEPLDIVRGVGSPARALIDPPVYPPRTTLENVLVRVPGPVNTYGFRYATVGLANGEPWVVRTDFTLNPAAQTTHRLIAFAQMSDMQIVDYQSPLRVEFLDAGANQGSPHHGSWPTASAYRPHEMLSTQLTDAICRAIRNVGTGPATGLPLALTITTGDVVDNAQLNEARWYIGLLDGEVVHPDSGDPDRCESVVGELFHHIPGRIALQYWNPERNPPSGPVSRPYRAGFPTVRGLLDAARRPFQATGLGMPWYTAFGNHDLLVQGNARIDTGFDALKEISRGSEKIIDVFPLPDVYEGNTSLLLDLLWTGLGLTIVERPVTPDTGRQLLSRQAFINAHFNTSGTPAGHGFTLNSDRAYYAIPSAPTDLFQFLCLDSTNLNEFGSEGWIDNAQFAWLEERLVANSSRYRNPSQTGWIHQAGVPDKLFILYCHHTIDTMNKVTFGRDPSGTLRALGKSGEQLKALMLRFPNVIMLVNGHHHANHILPHMTTIDGRNSGFWEINTASHIDWPIQARIIEVAEASGVLSIFTTMVDAHAPLSYGDDLSTPTSLAGLGRELAANNPQETIPAPNSEPGVVWREGSQDARNTQLLLHTPFPITAPLVSVAAANRADGRFEMFAIDSSDRAWRRTQSAPGTDSWSDWQGFGTAMASIGAERNNVGQIEVFGVDRQGRVWHRWQLTPNSDSWSGWVEFGGTLSTAPSAISVTRWHTSLVVYGINGAGQLFGRTQYAGPTADGGGRWSDWTLQDGTLSAIAGQKNPYGRVELFGVDGTGRIYHRWELPTSGWSGWVHFGTVGWPASIAATSFGPGEGVAVYATSTSGELWERIQYTAPNGSNGGGTWSNWVLHDGSLETIAAGTNPSNKVELFGINAAGTLFHRWEAGDPPWSAWAVQEGPAAGTSLVVVPDVRGLDLFAARQALESISLAVGRVTNTNDPLCEFNGKCRWQSRNPGTYVTRRTAVDLDFGVHTGPCR